MGIFHVISSDIVQTVLLYEKSPCSKWITSHSEHPMPSEQVNNYGVGCVYNFSSIAPAFWGLELPRIPSVAKFEFNATSIRIASPLRPCVCHYRFPVKYARLCQSKEWKNSTHKPRLPVHRGATLTNSVLGQLRDTTLAFCVLLALHMQYSTVNDVAWPLLASICLIFGGMYNYLRLPADTPIKASVLPRVPLLP